MEGEDFAPPCSTVSDPAAHAQPPSGQGASSFEGPKQSLSLSLASLVTGRSSTSPGSWDLSSWLQGLADLVSAGSPALVWTRQQLS
eukprot:CAMPEP_0195140908 /NCGR_PEP_ID=MMETSP0448-20130528/162019_1 /TAXON_ID=66468 /ORGANISM="Heterocapsa triquestra, Strain CCMP 448" /LENGTH=85 /DNA_ID=CAMNT_0040179277 /DNA_START=1 /DNA_END=254 /DNA_ORIENTATION=+